jgi:hypothetical protein
MRRADFIFSILRRSDVGRRVGLGALAAAGVFAIVFSASAQDMSGAELWGQSGCANCHGNLAAGGGDAAYPAGPNLRRTKLDHDQLVETISCGRPSTPMPFNLKGAYTEISCYGLPLGPAPEGTTSGASMTADQINALVDFLVAEVVGKTKITKQNCALFAGGNEDAPECQQYH